MALWLCQGVPGSLHRQPRKQFQDALKLAEVLLPWLGDRRVGFLQGSGGNRGYEQKPEKGWQDLPSIHLPTPRRFLNVSRPGRGGWKQLEI